MKNLCLCILLAIIPFLFWIERQQSNALKNQTDQQGMAIWTNNFESDQIVLQYHVDAAPKDKDGKYIFKPIDFKTAIPGDLVIHNKLGTVTITPEGKTSWTGCSAEQASLIVRQGFIQCLDEMNKKEEKQNDQHGTYP